MTRDELKIRLSEIYDWLVREFSAIRTGQATPALLDSVKVDAYGTSAPLQQVGSVTVEDAKTLRVSTWDHSVNGAVESAIRNADLGVSVVVDDGGVRVIFPELTSERREQLLKIAKNKLEEARISVRAARDDAMKALDTKSKHREISEDEKFSQKELVQSEIDDANTKLDTLFSAKQTEIQA